MLDHADAGDCVEAFAGEVAVVLRPDAHAMVQTGLAHPRASEGRLRLGEGDPDDLDAMISSRMDGKAAPAAADVEHPLACLQPELAAGQLQLRFLSRLQRLAVSGEESTAIGHRPVQEQGEELVGDVVVMLYRQGIPDFRVPGAARAQLHRRCRQGQGGAGRADRGEHQLHPVPESEGWWPPPIQQGDQGVEIVDLEIARDIRSTEAELSRRTKRVCHCLWRTGDEGGPTLPRCRHDRTVPELDREGTFWKQPLDLPPQRRRRRDSHL